jgi:hypothetical protein
MVVLTAKSLYITLRLLRITMQVRKLTALFVLLALSLARLPLARACAVCVTGAEGAVADAYDWSVLFLMAMPYLVMGSVAGYFVYAYRRASAEQEQDAADAEAGIYLSLEQKESDR